ncbi:four helix bundle protein [Nodularia sp. LEGE 04288]|uniref:four helix bundle protein n=1 Tax=Nodularia sp. LEGE 04288 TaxID=1828639 RepID=UPI001D1273D2|nr:four helix bundle protein [Nodularia sp. LEGE 04288]
MNNKPSIQSYQDLKAWQEAMNLGEECYRVTKQFPKEETYGMTSQIRRASVSIPANIAEGYGRRTRGEYIQFLYMKRGCRVWGVGCRFKNNLSKLYIILYKQISYKHLIYQLNNHNFFLIKYAESI